MRQVVDESSGLPGERIELTGVPGVPGVEVLRADAPARTWRWYHETYTISAALRPMRTEWTYRNRLYRTEAESFALMEPGEMHADRRKLDAYEEIRVLFLTPALVEAAARELDAGDGAIHWNAVQVRRPDVLQRILGLHEAFERDASALERESRFAAVLEGLLEFTERRPRAERPWTEPDAVRRARELLHARWADAVRLDDLVAAAGVGPFRLLRAFHAAVGLPPHAYQIRVRLARAMALIRLGMPLAEVALETGFADQSHLARHFRRAIGVSPGRYRRAVR